MTAKTLEDELKIKNKGLLSVEVVEAPSGNLPQVIEESVEEIIDGTEDESHKEFAYLCKLAGRDDGYISKIEYKLEGLLDNHNFLKKIKYHKRIREDEGLIDYLFVKEFADKPGTYGVTLDIDESENFENLLGKYNKVVKNRKTGDYGGSGTLLISLLSKVISMPNESSYHPKRHFPIIFSYFAKSLRASCSSSLLATNSENFSPRP